ncbi:MAG: hypothetical protein WC538_22180 [Thermoanaerobaculia bacterium]|jgi:hypothetical protein
MAKVIERRRAPIRRYTPSEEEILASPSIRRCGVCNRVWPDDRFTVEDGIERCPNCVDVTTASYRALMAKIAAEQAAKPMTFPVSQFRLAPTRPSSITSITNAAGTRLKPGAPLVMSRGSNYVVLLNGVNFASSDTITYTDGISDASPLVRTSTLVTLTITAAPSTTPGRGSLTFNGYHFLDLFAIR